MELIDSGRSVLKYPGGKAKASKWITSFFPEHNFYLEPFFGGGSVFFNKKPCKHETINDIDGMVVNFFRVCRDNPDELARLLYWTPYARDEFLGIQEYHAGQEIQLSDSDVENARRFAVRCWQGFGSKLSDRVGWKNSKASNGYVNPDAWGNLPEIVIAAAERLKKAQIENTDGIALIKACNKNDCLIYADPPYLISTRRSRMYRYEMGDVDSHNKLLDALIDHSGYVVLSGYENDLYAERLIGWEKIEKSYRTNSAKLRRECIWVNFSLGDFGGKGVKKCEGGI